MFTDIYRYQLASFKSRPSASRDLFGRLGLLLRASKSPPAAMHSSHQLRRALCARAAQPSRSAALRCFSTGGPQDAAASTTHFGFQQVREEEKKPMVASVFHKVADRCVAYCSVRLQRSSLPRLTSLSLSLSLALTATTS